MRFLDGKIHLKIYKVLKVSRIIRSLNVFDKISQKVDEINEISLDGSNSNVNSESNGDEGDLTRTMIIKH